MGDDNNWNTYCLSPTSYPLSPVHCPLKYPFNTPSVYCLYMNYWEKSRQGDNFGLMHIPSRLIQEAVDAFTRLPGIGKRTALRLVLHLLKEDKESAGRFADAVSRMRNEIQFCRDCHNIADGEVCEICTNPRRNRAVACVVEDIRDVIAIESTQQYNGLYHVLGGILSPLEGIGPEQLNIDSLISKAEKGDIREVIMALSPTIEGDTTLFYLARRLQPYDIKVTTIARGIAFGGELEYADETTLARSITNRLPYESYLVNARLAETEKAGR